jgi:paraquat-inducible protein B
MTEPPDRSTPAAGVQRTAAIETRGRWPGLIWALPLAALLIVAYFGLQALAHNGVDVVVSFDSAADAKPGDTQVVYKGLSIGHVTKVDLSDDGHRVDMTLKLDPSTKPLLRAGTRFWLVGAKPSLTDINSLRAAHAGVVIGMAPGAGPYTRRFEGLDQPPPVLPGTPGSRYVLVSSEIGAARPGADVFYHGLEVGKVTDVDLLGRNNFKTRIFVSAPYDRFVRGGTLFYNTSPVSISLAGGSINTQLAPGNAALGGGVEFDTPADVIDQTPAPSGASFILFWDKPHAIAGPRGPQVFYRVLFDGPVGQLDVGSPVMLRGFEVGSVTSRSLEIDPATGALSTPVTVGIEPERLRPQAGVVSVLTPGLIADTDRTVGALLRAGYRVRLAQNPPLFGGRIVELARAPGASRAVLGARRDATEFPILPSAPSGDLSSVTANANDILTKIDKVPIVEIGQDVRRIMSRLDALTGSPATRQSVLHLSHSLGQLDAMMTETRPKVGPLIDNLNRSAEQLQTLATSANAVVSGDGATQDASLPGLLRELTDAARSMRDLADYLGRHPEAVLRGKAKEK